MRLLFLTLCALVGCGGAAGSCKIPALKGEGPTCVDFVNGYSGRSARTVCDLAASSTYLPDPCTIEGRVGHCTGSSPDGKFTQQVSYYAPTTVERAQEQCTPPSKFAAD